MDKNGAEPIRILHVAGGMNRGGAETWLMHILRNIDRDHYKMDFLVNTAEKFAYDDEIRMLGSKVIPCLGLPNPFAYARSFKRVLNDYGPYDVIHAHVQHFNGFILWLAQRLGVPVRIVHSHTAESSGNTRLIRRLYTSQMERWIRSYATEGFAVSEQAASALFGGDWSLDERFKLLYCSIDLSPFHSRVDSASIRASLSIPADALVIGHIGRIAHPKNHEFLIDVASEINKREPNMRLLLVGDGPLRFRIEQKIAQQGLEQKVILTGSRPDVPELLMGAMDVFVMPSLFEGLPLAGIEAQAAGLPSFVSDSITEEMDIVKPLVTRMALSAGPFLWADEILEIAGRAPVVGQREALKLLEQTPFDIRIGAEILSNAYINKQTSKPTCSIPKDVAS